MKKFLLLLIPIGVILFFSMQEEGTQRRIAILTPASHPSLELMEQGFKEILGDDYVYTTYNAQGNKILMHSEVQEIIRKSYDLVLTLGVGATQMTKEVFQKRGVEIPIVFTAVNRPEELQIVPAPNITGVKELLNFEEELGLLFAMKPNVQTLMLPYNPTHPGLDRDCEEIAALLEAQGKRLLPVEVFQTGEMQQKLPYFVSQADAILVLKDHTIVCGLDLLVKLAEKHKIPLVTSDLDSPDRGAALGYGVHEIEFGREAARKAKAILEEGCLPEDIPVSPVAEFTHRINPDAAKRQGVET